MPDTSLVVIDPGHFHATLVQQQMHAIASSKVQNNSLRPAISVGVGGLKASVGVGYGGS